VTRPFSPEFAQPPSLSTRFRGNNTVSPELHVIGCFVETDIDLTRYKSFRWDFWHNILYVDLNTLLNVYVFKYFRQ
jgi:hypothetical protein